MRFGNREIPTASIRKSKIPKFKRRTLVYFTECVRMTTRLAGDVTHFQPFDKGCKGGVGNPHNPAGHSGRSTSGRKYSPRTACSSRHCDFPPHTKKVAELLRLFYVPSNFDSSPGEIRRR